MRTPVWLLIGLLAVCPLRASDNPFPKAPSEVEEALRSRVTEFYTYFQQRKYRKAEALVDEKSRDYFYESSKKPILGFELSSMEFQGDFRQAKVLVNVMIMLPMMGPKPAPFPLTGTWRWVEDNWYIHMEGAKPGTIKEGPFGPMKINPDTAAPVGAGASQGSPSLSAEGVKRSLQRMYKVEPTKLRFPAAAAEPITRSVQFINPGPARLSVTATEEIHTLPGLRIEFDRRQLEPGEKLPISFIYDPGEARIEGSFRIIFSVLPLKQIFGVTLEFPK